jgi:hypothetical protein
MNMETPEITTQEEEPIYFAPKGVSLISDVASISSWVVLVGFIAAVVLQILSLRTQIITNGYILKDLIKEPSFFVYLFTNMIIPLLTGLVFFVILQAAAVGLNMLLEKDFNTREAKSKIKA